MEKKKRESRKRRDGKNLVRMLETGSSEREAL